MVIKEKTKFRFNPYSESYLKDPYPTYKVLRNEYPVYKYKTFSEEQVLVSRYKDIKSVLTDKRFRIDNLVETIPTEGNLVKSSNTEMFFLKESLKHWLFFINPPKHTFARGIVSRQFTASSLRKIKPYIEDVVDTVFEQFNQSKEIEIISTLGRVLPALVAAKMLGVKIHDLDALITHSEELFSVFEPPLSVNTYKKMCVSADYIKNIVLTELNERKGLEPKQDLLGVLMSPENNLSQEELISFTIMLFSVGQETTENYIANSIYALMENRLQFDKICKDPSLIENAVKELARYDTSVQFVSRVANKKLEIAGVEVQKGERVLLALGAANHDEDQYTNPDILDVTRKDIGNLPFGTGIHFCLGSALAKLQLEVVLNKLIQFPNVQLKKNGVTRRKTVVIRSLSRLELVLD